MVTSPAHAPEEVFEWYQVLLGINSCVTAAATFALRVCYVVHSPNRDTTVIAKFGQTHD